MSDTALIPAWVGGQLLPFDKIAVHREGMRHQAVSVFLTRGDTILLQRRAPGKYHTPGLWANTCCTHPHWGESPADCAERRLLEELGITGITPRLAGQVEYRADVGGGMTEHEVVDIFVTEAPADIQVTPNPNEVMEVGWVGLTALIADVAAEPGRFTPWLRIYLRDHREMLFGAGGVS